MERLISDWDAGHNRFDQDGEVLLGAFDRNSLIAIGGLNRDPYSSQLDIGRIRHVYVLAGWRARGVGKALVAALINASRDAFSEVRLRTDTDEAARFYDKCGFERIGNETASHRKFVVQP